MTAPATTADDPGHDDPTFSDHNAAMNYYAGPFCTCGDYSCAAMRNADSPCSTLEGELGTRFFDDDENYWSYEIGVTRQNNEDDAIFAAARLLIGGDVDDVLDWYYRRRDTQMRNAVDAELAAARLAR